MAEPLRINNRVVLHLLEALQLLQMKANARGLATETRKVSFRALDIEQIGHVYEGLLDHTAVRAEGPMLGIIGAQKLEPEVSLVELERLREEGPEALIKFLKGETKKTEKALAKLVPTPSVSLGEGEEEVKPEIDGLVAQRLRVACGNDDELYGRVLPWMGLVRLDTFGYPVVIPAGTVFVTQGSDRRQTGTHYTPRSLTEEIVKYTLEPLVYEGPAEGWPEAQWRLKSAAELLRLKVCDIAMGSGAFLVQTCRYLAGKLVEAWAVETPLVSLGKATPSVPLGKGEGRLLRIAPDGSLSAGEVGEEILPEDEEERLLVARRIVAGRCLYGVDKNPLAVEMAKLSLWLITLAKGRPFSFLDHALKCGDSLLGLTRSEQIEFLHLQPDNEAVQLQLASETWKPILQAAIAQRERLASFSVNDIGDLREKERLYGEAEALIERLRFVGDYLVARGLAEAGKTADLTAEELMVISQRIAQELAGEADEEESAEIVALKQSTARMMNLGNPEGQAVRRPFHWLLEFPEVFLDREAVGFDAIVGNPPFQGGKQVSTYLGTRYSSWLKNLHPHGSKEADLSGHFVLRAFQQLRNKGVFGLIATSSISQGSTRDLSLSWLIDHQAQIIKAATDLSRDSRYSMGCRYRQLGTSPG